MSVHGSTFRLTGPLNPIALAAALADVIERHEASHPATALVNRRHYRQAPQVDVPLDLIDLRRVEPAERWDRARAVTAATLARPFATGRPPLLHATLVRVAEHDRVLAVALHHAICVDASSDVLLDKVFLAYRSLVGGDGPQVTPLHPNGFDAMDRDAALLTGPSRR
jgi:Condensation domain